MTKLSESKNAIVSAHLAKYEANLGSQTKAEMLTALCEELVSELEAYKEQLALSTKSVGTYVLHVPVQYMFKDAKEKDLSLYKDLKAQLVKITNGVSEGMILPALTDENGNRMFTLDYVGPTVCGV